MLRRGWLYISLLIYPCFYTVQAQNDEKAEYVLSSPYAAIMMHVGSLEEEIVGAGQYEIAAKPFLQNGRSLEKAIKLAIGLKDILKEKGIQLALDKIPHDPNYIDPAAKFHKYQLTETLPEVYLVKVYNQWIYSEATVQYVETFYPTDYFLTKRSSSWVFKCLYHKIFFDIYVWQVLALLVCFLVGLGLYKLFNLLLRKPYRLIASNTEYEEIEIVTPPLTMLIIGWLFKVALPFLKLPSGVADKLLIYTRGFLFFVTMLLCYHLVDLFTSYIIHKQTVEKKLNFNLVLLPMVKVSLKVLVIITGIIITLQSLGLNVEGLLAGVGIGGLGFALASQDTIKNFFGSLVILTDKPFNIGDYIVAERLDGKVEEIGFRSTRIRTRQDSIIYVPNGKLADTYIDNYGPKQYKYFSTVIAMPYTTSALLIETFIEGLRKIIERCPAAREGKYFVYLYDLKESMFYIKFDVNFNVTDYEAELENRQEILLNISKLAQTLSIHFAFPTHTLHMETSPDSDSGVNDLKERLQDFFNKDSKL